MAYDFMNEPGQVDQVIVTGKTMLPLVVKSFPKYLLKILTSRQQPNGGMVFIKA
jgi:hypothetical protein